MNISQQIDFIEAAANPFPLQASFKKADGGGYECKMCGAKVKDQAACTDHLLMKHREMEGREFSEKRRKNLAKSGDAMPGGGFPIVNKEDLANAKRAIGRAKNPAAARRHINKRAKELGAKPIGAQVEFSPAMRLRMPKKAGEGTTTENPQYTGGQPPLQARGFGMKKGSSCGHHGFALHKGAGYAKKAASMGHRIPLSAAALIQRRPIRDRKKTGQAFSGYKVIL